MLVCSTAIQDHGNQDEPESEETHWAISPLGFGSYGEVVLVAGENSFYAVKRLRAQPMSDFAYESATQRLQSELQILSWIHEKGNHRNVIEWALPHCVPHVPAFYNGAPVIPMEYCAGDHLMVKLIAWYEQHRTFFDADIARRYFCQIVAGLQFLHSIGVYHGDLKLDNILVDERDQIKLIDFGSALLHPVLAHECLVDSPDALADDSTTPGSELASLSFREQQLGLAAADSPLRVPEEEPWYVPTERYGGFMQQLPPEVSGCQCCRGSGAPQHDLLRNFYSPAAADVWSLGTCLFQLMYGLQPFFFGKLPNNFSLWLRQSNPADAPHSDYWAAMSNAGVVPSPQAKDLFEQMFNVHLEERITVAEIARHPWLAPGTPSPVPVMAIPSSFPKGGHSSLMEDEVTRSPPALDRSEFSDVFNCHPAALDLAPLHSDTLDIIRARLLAQYPEAQAPLIAQPGPACSVVVEGDVLEAAVRMHGVLEALSLKGMANVEGQSLSPYQVVATVVLGQLPVLLSLTVGPLGTGNTLDPAPEEAQSEGVEVEAEGEEGHEAADRSSKSLVTCRRLTGDFAAYLAVYHGLVGALQHQE